MAGPVSRSKGYLFVESLFVRMGPGRGFFSLRVLSRAWCSILPLNWIDNSKQDSARSFDSTVITFIRCTVCNLNVIRLAFYAPRIVRLVLIAKDNLLHV